MFKMRAVAAVERYGRPLVAQNSGPGTARVDHRFDRQHHALGQLRALALLAEVRNLRRFVELGSNSVSNKIPYYAESRRFHVLLDRRSNMANRVANLRLLDALVERRFRDLEQLLQFIGEGF